MSSIQVRKGKSWLSGVLAAIMLLGAFPAAGQAQTGTGTQPTQGAAAVGTGTDYYIDSQTGSDQNAGVQQQKPWKSLAKANAQTFKPGDRILLKSGAAWDNQTLAPKGSGTAGRPIVIDRYGSGDKPKIRANGKHADAILLSNQQHWEIRNLDVSNQTPPSAVPGASLGDYRGIHITGQDAGTLQYFRIKAVDVHDVSGEIAWIGGSIPANPKPGIRFKTGWDGSKKTGGIVFDTSVANLQAPVRATVFQDVVIEDSTVKNTSFGGIIFKQYAGNGSDGSQIVPTGWGTRKDAQDPNFTPHSGIVIRNNFITQQGTPYGCNGMYLTGIRGGLVERNVVDKAGTSGIEAYYADDITIQYNEVMNTEQKAGGADSNGIDPDKGTTNILIQYNYMHGNGDGILICQFVFGDTVIRYNVLENNKRYPIYLHSDAKAVADVYNNTIYNEVSGYMVYGYGSSLKSTYRLRNNILYTTRPVRALTESPTITYDTNSYYSPDGAFGAPASDANPRLGDPMLTNPGTGGTGSQAQGPALNTLGGYQLKAESPLIERGLTIVGSQATPARDFAGRLLYNGQADPGAFEFYDDSTTTATLVGRVTDAAGKAVAGAAVSDAAGGTPAITNDLGRYVIRSVPVGRTLKLRAAKSGYAQAESATFTVRAGNVVTTDLALVSNAAGGSLSGKVYDDNQAAAADVTVVLSLGDQKVAETVSGADGSYTFPAVAAGEGYTLSAEKAGFRPANASGIRVGSGERSQAPDLYLAGTEARLIHGSDFDDLQPGAAPSAPWQVRANGGTVGAADVPDRAGKSMKLTRSSNSGVTSLSQSFPKGTVKGIVTLTADVMKQDGAGSTDWFNLPYVYSSGGTASANTGVSLAFSKGQIMAYKGSESTKLMAYEPGKWYNLRLVMNTASDKYDLYVNGAAVAEQVPFRNAIEDIGSFSFSANSLNYGTVHVDNVRLYQGIPAERSDAGLADLTTDFGTLSKESDEAYRLEVPHFKDTVNLTATLNSPEGAALTINGEPAVSGKPSAVAAAEGENTVPVAVTAEDGTTVRTVQVTVVRTAAALDSTLQKLEVVGTDGKALPLSPEFAYNTQEYELKVPANLNGLTIRPTAGAPLTEVRVNGTALSSGSDSAVINLSASTAPILVATASADGTDYRTYTIRVSRAAAPAAAASPAAEPAAVEPAAATPAEAEPAAAKPAAVEPAAAEPAAVEPANEGE